MSALLLALLAPAVLASSHDRCAVAARFVELTPLPEVSPEAFAGRVEVLTASRCAPVGEVVRIRGTSEAVADLAAIRPGDLGRFRVERRTSAGPSGVIDTSWWVLLEAERHPEPCRVQGTWEAVEPGEPPVARVRVETATGPAWRCPAAEAGVLALPLAAPLDAEPDLPAPALFIETRAASGVYAAHRLR